MGKKNSIQPLFDYVLIKHVPQEERTPSGIILPENAKEKPQMGEVVAVGPGAENAEGKIQPMHVKVGQKVLYKKWGGNEVKIDGEEMLIVEQKDIMAIMS